MMLSLTVVCSVEIWISSAVFSPECSGAAPGWGGGAVSLNLSWHTKTLQSTAETLTGMVMSF